MKTKFLFMACSSMILLFSFSSFKSALDLKESINKIEKQEGFVVYATYDGKTDSGYNFVATDRNGEKKTLIFQKVNDAVLSAYDLNVETYVGTMFKVTFSKDSSFSEKAIDINTITKLNSIH